ncbi:MAG: hypothetical protein KUL75_04165 [Sterolibacterium sp.]|nr:hypothetical protein [Sterolibacterium sp.]
MAPLLSFGRHQLGLPASRVQRSAFSVHFAHLASRTKTQPLLIGPVHAELPESFTRAHSHFATTQESRWSENRPLPGRLKAKLHLAVNALGNSLHVILSAGQAIENGP